MRDVCVEAREVAVTQRRMWGRQRGLVWVAHVGWAPRLPMP